MSQSLNGALETLASPLQYTYPHNHNTSDSGSTSQREESWMQLSCVRSMGGNPAFFCFASLYPTAVMTRCSWLAFVGNCGLPHKLLSLSISHTWRNAPGSLQAWWQVQEEVCGFAMQGGLVSPSTGHGAFHQWNSLPFFSHLQMCRHSPTWSSSLLQHAWPMHVLRMVQCRREHVVEMEQQEMGTEIPLEIHADREEAREDKRALVNVMDHKFCTMESSVWTLYFMLLIYTGM